MSQTSGSHIGSWDNNFFFLLQNVTAHHFQTQQAICMITTKTPMLFVAPFLSLIFPIIIIIVFLFPREKTNLIKENIVTEQSGLRSKITLSCK